MLRRLQCASSPTRTPSKIPGNRSRKSNRILGLPKRFPYAASFSTWTRGAYGKSNSYLNTSAPPDSRSLVLGSHNSCFLLGRVEVDLPFLLLLKSRRDHAAK